MSRLVTLRSPSVALQPPPKWRRPPFFLRRLSPALYDAKDKDRFEDLKEAPEPGFDPRVVVIAAEVNLSWGVQ